MTRNLAYSAAGVREFDDWATAWGWYYEQPQDVQRRIGSAAQQLKAKAATAQGVAKK
ncbi:hypothetical protein [Caballeronia sp. LjRoot31]|uniref:hypothetical protein n=1 Tax=Caballeronia sp. LjRoot31 TaxID=3342324 RepID=UPI003ECCCCBB